MIGIILHPPKLKRMIKGTERHEQLAFYQAFADSKGIDFCFFSPSQIKNTRLITSYIYSPQTKKMHKEKISIPQINIMRTTRNNQKQYAMMKKLEKKYNIQFLNLLPSRHKFKLHTILHQDSTLQPYLPYTEVYSPEKCFNLLKRYSRLILKPVNGSLGEGICKIEKKLDHENQYLINYTYQQKQVQARLNVSSLKKFLLRLIKSKEYLIQPWLSFMKFQGSKFDIRSSVQKNKQGEWQVTGLVVRLAAPGSIVTNVAQGGRALSFTTILPLLSPSKRSEIIKISKQIAQRLEKVYPSTFDLGLDLALSEDGKLWFIEANYCDERYAFREAGNIDEWKASYKIPLEYAYQLAKRVKS